MFSILKYLYKKRIQNVGNSILPFIKKGDSLLDFGCSSMALLKYIASKRKINYLGIDIVNFKNKDERYIKYDGGKLPFEDNQFDVVLAVFVLHHTNNPEFYLKELIRVSNNRIILCEDTYNTIFGKITIKFFDWIINVPFGSDCGDNFKSIQEWKYIINKNKVILKTLKRFYPHPIPFVPTTNVIIEIIKNLH